MKYIKKFESRYGEQRDYWIIPLQPDKCRIALRKIGIEEENIPLWIDDLKSQYWDDATRVIIYKVIDSDGFISREYWDYSKDYKYQDGDKFMGEIKVEDWEVNADKYNL